MQYLPETIYGSTTVRDSYQDWTNTLDALLWYESNLSITPLTLSAPRFEGAGGVVVQEQEERNIRGTGSVEARPDTPKIDRSREPVSTDADWDAFRAGYRANGGKEQYLEHFVKVVLPCEGSAWAGYNGYNYYWSRAQFSLDTWYKVITHFGINPQDKQAQEAAADDPYWVGQAVAWWSNLTTPSEQWGCW